MSDRHPISDAPPSSALGLALPAHGSGRSINQELEESEARYRTLFEQSPLGVFTYGRDLRLTDCNGAFVRLLHSTYEKLRGLDLRLLRDHRMTPVLERVLDGEPMLYEGDYEATTSSAKVAIAMWLTPLRSAEGDVIGGIGIVEDITLQRAARQAIAKSEASFRALVEHAPDAIGVFRAGQHLYVNPKLAEYLGYTRDEHFAKPVFELIHPGDHALFRERAAQRDRGEKVGPAEFRLVHRDGHSLLADITSINIEYDGGPAVLVFIRDVTERKQMQLRLLQSDRLASVGMLAAGIAHEINNPLAYLMTSLEVLARYHLPELARQLTTDAQRDLVTKITESIRAATDGAERMRRIVRDVKAFARGDDEARSPVDVRQVADAALQLVSHEIKLRARLVREFEEVPFVLASESRLGQVILNLLVNALQAMAGPGDHEVRVRTRRGEAGAVVIEVTDTGEGIPPEALPRVFDPFYTTKPIGVGTGLGLFVCHGIVTSMGGTLDVESVVGAGTTVRVTLPAATAETRPSAAAKGESSSPPARRARVLLVDDEPSLGRAIAAALEDDHDVTYVTSGEAALAEIAKGGDYDVILCDLMMPGVTGIDVWRAVAKERPHLADRFVFVTGGAFTPEAMAFLDEGHPYLEKPFDLRELRAMLRERVGGGSAKMRPPALNAMAFHRTFRALEAEPEARSRLTMFAAVALLAAWGLWFARARVAVYATCRTARVEVTRATHPVDAPVAGRVLSVDVALDQVVKEGDVLAQLDDQVERLSLGQARAREQGLGPQVEATRAEIAAEERALGDLGNQENAAIAEATARMQEATIATALAKEEALRVDKLHVTGAVSDVEQMRARADADQKGAGESAARSQLVKLQHQYRTDHDDRRTRIASLALDASKLEADLATVKAQIATLEHDIERRRVLAPAAGRVGEIGTVRAGTVLKEGERIATIVSSGDLRVVAQYAPAEALGRVHAGQTGRVRLEGFPWTEYGEVVARVTDVAREVRDGTARVELEVVRASPRIPLQHGLPATVQVEIEEATPAALVLRAAGRLVSSSREGGG